MKEIVTVQIGGFANFVGSHFWNFQDEILGLAEQVDGDPCISASGQDMDVLFRVGETRQGSLGVVSSSGTLYGQPPAAEVSSVSTWNGPVTTFRLESHEKNKFLQSLDDEEEVQHEGPSNIVSGSTSGTRQTTGVEDVHMFGSYERDQALVQSLEDGVQYWTDYLKCHLHPSSVYQIPGVWQGVTAFEDYGCGRGLISGEEQAEEVHNKLRLIVEECDHMQGFQFFVDNSDGFSCVGGDVVDGVVDEYGRTPILLFTVRPPDKFGNCKRSLAGSLHDSVSLARLAAAAHVTVPLGLPQIANSSFAEHLLIQEQKHFHTSAVYAAVINNITLPFRMEVSGPLVTSQVAGLGSVDMGTALRLLSCSSARKIALMEAAFPAPSVPESGKPYNLQKLCPLIQTTGTDNTGIQVAEMMVVQGAQLTGSNGPATVSKVHESLVCASDRLARAATNPRRGIVLSQVSISPCPLAIPLPFPCIFSPYIGRHGDILSRPVTPSNIGRGGLSVVSLPVTAKLSTSEAILGYIKTKRDDLRKSGLARSTVGPLILEGWGFAREDVEELCETLARMVRAYGDATETESSDSD